jgi:hypothetical protein
MMAKKRSRNRTKMVDERKRLVYIRPMPGKLTKYLYSIRITGYSYTMQEARDEQDS